MSELRPGRILAVERHGIDAVPRVERTKGWGDLFVIRKGQLDLDPEDPRGRQVQYRRGVNWVAWFVVLVGTVVAVATPESLLASLVSMIVSAGLYWSLMQLFCPMHFVRRAP